MRLQEIVEGVSSDQSYAVRQLLRNPGFAVTAILTIALGIGANTAVFSVADAVLLRPLPYPGASRLVLVWDSLAKIGVKQMPVSAEDFSAFRAAPRIFESAAAFQQQDRTLITYDDPERVAVIASTPGLLNVLGASTTLGRSLVPDDWRDDHPRVAVISDSLFHRRFSSDRTVIGRTIRLDDTVYVIAGVLPKTFQFSLNASPVDVWTPLSHVAEPRKAQFAMLGHLNPGVSIQTAQQSVSAAAKHLEQFDHPYQGPNGEDPGYGAFVTPLREQLFGSFRTSALILISASLLLLLIACANVANLLLARRISREQEVTMRRLLGASRARLAQQWITEAALLSVLGTVVGVIASYGGIRVLRSLMPDELLSVAAIGINGRVLLFACLISVLTCLLFLVLPLLSLRETNVRGPRRTRRGANVLVAAEVALALLVTIGSGLLMKSFDHLRNTDVGFHADHLLTMEINLIGPRYAQPSQRIRFLSALQARIQQQPGVAAASGVDRLPVFTVGVDTREGNPFSVDGHPFDPNRPVRQIAHTQTAEAGYFKTMGIPLLAGRSFSETDDANAPPVAVVNETLARRIFPKGDAIGKRILLGAPSPDGRWMTIIGIIGDIRTGALDLPPMPQFYSPASQDAPAHMFIVIRSYRDPLAMEHAASLTVHHLDPEQPIEHMKTMQEHVDSTMWQPRLQASLLSFFAMASLLLAAVGIYGVVTCSTLQRTKEIGIRMALGADSGKVVSTVLAGGLRPVFVGIAIGLAAALLLTRYLIGVLYEVQPNDPWTIAGAGIVLGSVALVAYVAPALRAVRVDPTVTLRYE